MNLRTYQTECVNAVMDALTNGTKSALVVMPTGTGKTQVYLSVAERWMAERGQKVIAFAHREELIFQPAERWKQFTGYYPTIEMAEFKSGNDAQQEIFQGQPDDRLIVSTVQTLNSGKRCKNCTLTCVECSGEGRLPRRCSECDGEGCDDCEGKGRWTERCKPCDGDGWIKTKENCDRCYKCFIRRMMKFKPEDIGLVIIDEAHHAPATVYKRICEYFGQNTNLKIMGCTATPDRTDEEALGQVFDEVVFDYQLPQAIEDGWLVDIEQQFIVIDELNLSRVRTTAGDLNEGDLEREMIAEEILHKVTTPTVEVACGLEMGTIDRLISEGNLHELPSIVEKSEPTLVFATSVAHAERIAEIINRYLPNSAVCIVGTTPRQERRDLIKRYQDRQIQFLVSCGVFFEGFDAPSTSVIAMARPTKSRALYSQAIGRGTRPLPGVVDGLATSSERVHAIAFSEKPIVTVLDFVGNSGRHKLISTADILGGNYPDEIVEKAVTVAQAADGSVDMRRLLLKVQEEEEERKREKARNEARVRYELEQEMKRRSAESRRAIVAGATYQVAKINPFDVFEMGAVRQSGFYAHKAPSEKQTTLVKKFMGEDTPTNLTRQDASRLIGECIRRREKGLCTYKQAKLLQRFGVATKDLSFDRASSLITQIKANGWKLPAKV